MRLRLALAGLLLLLAACGGGGDGRAPFVESRIPPTLGPRFWAPDGWAWGLLKIGDAPAQRYGVSSTLVTPQAQVLILTGYGESAEAWFETARDLNARGYSVWVLERAGQGGSERYVLPRDLGHAPRFQDDIAAVKTLARMMVAGAPKAPLIILGHSVGGLVAVAAVEQGAPAEGLILTTPAFAAGDLIDSGKAGLVKAGLGRLPAAWNSGWARGGPDGAAAGLTSDPWRGTVQMAWQTANPDLRMGGPSLGWLASFRATSKAIEPGLKDVETPTLLLSAGADRNADAAAQAQICRAMAHCGLYSVKGGRHALHLERDAIRAPWLAAVDSFVRTRAGSRPILVGPAVDHGL
ncbi:MAG: alpha/beta hydrolase [Caulobacter sp.]